MKLMTVVHDDGCPEEVEGAEEEEVRRKRGKLKLKAGIFTNGIISM